MIRQGVFHGNLIQQRLLRTADAAQYLGISPKKLLRLGHLGQIRFAPGAGLHAPTLWDIHDLDAWIDRSKSC